ncbi:lytic transglycosylase domain-containing protein, partial [Klebsiella pneumoniae]|nr:lytic transglycosylase domain-containing protein [Klebsiella pneumoniae]
STGGGKVYMAALQQISANAPSAAVAGILMDKPGGIVAKKSWFSSDITVSPESAAQTILSGSAARRGTKDAKGIAMPKDT